MSVIKVTNENKGVIMTIQNIIDELQDVPEEKIDELYQFVHFLASNKNLKNNKEKIMSFAGAFNDMSDEDYSDFVRQTKETRNNIFAY